LPPEAVLGELTVADEVQLGAVEVAPGEGVGEDAERAGSVASIECLPGGRVPLILAWYMKTATSSGATIAWVKPADLVVRPT